MLHVGASVVTPIKYPYTVGAKNSGDEGDFVVTEEIKKGLSWTKISFSLGVWAFVCACVCVDFITGIFVGTLNICLVTMYSPLSQCGCACIQLHFFVNVYALILVLTHLRSLTFSYFHIDLPRFQMSTLVGADVCDLMCKRVLDVAACVRDQDIQVIRFTRAIRLRRARRILRVLRSIRVE